MARSLVNLTKTAPPPHEADADVYIASVAAKVDEHAAALDALDSDPVDVTGARDDGTALANLLEALEAKGLITDSTTAS